MIVNKATLDALTTNFKVVFGQALQAAPQYLAQIATVVPSSSKSQDFPIGALLATIREWLGDRVEQNIAAWTKSLTNKSFEGTVAVDRDDIEDDQIGVYAPAIQQLAAIASRFPYEKVVEALDTDGFGATVTGFDSLPFFSNSHIWPGGYATVQDNLSAANLSGANAQAGITAMRGFRGPDGKVLNSKPSVILVAPDLEWTARELFLLPTTTGGAANPTYGMFSEANILIEPLLTAKHWIMLDCTKPIKPLVWQDRKAPAFVAMTNLDDESVFMRKKFRYGVDFRGTAAALAWWLAYGSTGT
jgi:phage major head subunit gpT-like protein